MSEKRWALKKPCEDSVRRMATILRNAGMGDAAFEEVHTYDPATESAVPHEVIRSWKMHAEAKTGVRVWTDRNNPDNYLPKPRPTLRESLRNALNKAGWDVVDGRGARDFENACREAGVDPDKVYDEGDE